MTIRQVSEATGIPSHTLRFWEKAFPGILNPSRTAGGQRRYSQHDIEVIENIKMYKEDGISLSQIKKKLIQKKDNQPKEMTLDLLAGRIAKIVEIEVYNYLKQNQGALSQKLNDR